MNLDLFASYLNDFLLHSMNYTLLGSIYILKYKCSQLLTQNRFYFLTTIQNLISTFKTQY